ncbi:hypothetical protein SEVIR_3G141150v4 [Setaria viridis]
MLHSLQDNLFGNYNEIPFSTFTLSSLLLLLCTFLFNLFTLNDPQDCSRLVFTYSSFPFMYGTSGFVDLYDVPHFIKTLKHDVRIVMSVPKITAQGKAKKLKAYKIDPPRDAPVTWYRTTALKKIRKYGAIYLTPFSHHLAEEIDDPELQRLRCRVNYHALRFTPNIMKTSSDIVK